MDDYLSETLLLVLEGGSWEGEYRRSDIDWPPPEVIFALDEEGFISSQGSYKKTFQSSKKAAYWKNNTQYLRGARYTWKPNSKNIGLSE